MTAERREAVLRRIEAAMHAAGRRDKIELLAVSKTQPAEAIRTLAGAGQRAFGENYVQEALGKIAHLRDLDLIWHHIGPIQSNKTADIAAHFDWVHGVDRDRIARRLSEQRRPDQTPLNVCVQVNISDEPTKSGVPPAQAADLCRRIAELPRLRLRGLMAIPAPVSAGADPRIPFAALRRLYETLCAEGLELDTLSAGMSDDLEHAIAEGSTLIRVGTALFGARRP